MRWTEHWRFETARLAVVFETAPCEDDPKDHFEFPQDIAAVEDGTVEWFDARVRVLDLQKATLHSRHELAADYLGCCAYNTVREFYTSHRDPDPMNRNCTIMRAARGNGNPDAKISICHYFPSMVSEAIDAARERFEALPKLRRRK